MKNPKRKRLHRSGEFHWKVKESVAGKYWLWWCWEAR